MSRYMHAHCMIVLRNETFIMEVYSGKCHQNIVLYSHGIMKPCIGFNVDIYVSTY